jgi:DNA adenine methylase
MSAPTRPILRYHGGKFRLAPWIISFFPKHSCYVEPFSGAASVLMLKKPVAAECYNDLDNAIVNVFRILRDPDRALELHRRVSLTPFSRAEFDWSYEDPVDDMDAAHKLIVKSFMGHGSDAATRSCRTGFRSKLTAGRGLPSAEWAGWADAIPSFTHRLKGVLIENRDAIEVIRRMDAPTTLFYVDPPYPHSTRSSLSGRSSSTHGYRHELTDDQHRALAGVLQDVRGMVVISG